MKCWNKSFLLKLLRKQCSCWCSQREGSQRWLECPSPSFICQTAANNSFPLPWKVQSEFLPILVKFESWASLTFPHTHTSENTPCVICDAFLQTQGRRATICFSGWESKRAARKVLVRQFSSGLWFITVNTTNPLQLPWRCSGTSIQLTEQAKVRQV